MKKIYKKYLMTAALTVVLSAVSHPLSAQTALNDPGWPRVYEKDGKQLTVYQPQVDYWNGFTNLHFRCAIAVSGVSKEEQFGVAEVDALTVTDHGARVVGISPLKRDLRFPNRPDAEVAALRQAVEELAPSSKVTTLSLDRVLAYLDPATQTQQRAVDVNLNPPTIYYSSRPAVLVMFMGKPQLKPVVPGGTDLMFVLNSNWDVLYDTASQLYFLLLGDGWLSSPDAVNGPWTPAGPLPASFSSIPANDNWAEVRQHIPGKNLNDAPKVFATTQPAELIVTKGDPDYEPIRGTKLMQVTDTDSVLFLHTGEKAYYFLVAGRWFRASQLSGPWTAASNDLPADFANIPSDSSAAFVKASVPGTREASDAVMLASVPLTTVVSTTNAPVQVTYNGPPQFVAIPGTTVQYAVNSPYSVFLVNGGYYCCDQGVWFNSASANGPWAFCSSVPPAIYTIPPSSPVNNVTYVAVQSSSPTTVTYAQTAGYSGEYVASSGVVMFGAGMPVATVAANDNVYNYPPSPAYYSYGCGATYDYGYGGYYSAAHVYGPYGGAGKTAAYNPATGTYSRSAVAYGPYDSAEVKQAYNPYTGGYAQAAKVNTPYGSAAKASAYNPNTGASAQAAARSDAYGSASAAHAYNPATDTSATHAQVNTANGSASRTYAQHGDQAAWGGSRTSAYGSASAVKTTGGADAATVNTQQGQTSVAKTQSGNYYADKDGTVYKKDASGGWSSNSGSGWQAASKPTTQSASATKPASSASRESMEYQEQARQYGSQQTQRTSQYQAAGGYSGGGRRR